MTTSTRRIHRTAPQFTVPDVRAAATWYRDVLGFDHDRIWGEPPCFCMPRRDDVIVMLFEVSDAARVHPNGANGETWDAYFWIDDADGLFEEFRSGGAEVVYEPTLRPLYQMKEFAIRDLNGYILAFGQDWPDA